MVGRKVLLLYHYSWHVSFVSFKVYPAGSWTKQTKRYKKSVHFSVVKGLKSDLEPGPACNK